jgi:hypothetical protein
MPWGGTLLHTPTASILDREESFFPGVMYFLHFALPASTFPLPYNLVENPDHTESFFQLGSCINIITPCGWKSSPDI